MEGRNVDECYVFDSTPKTTQFTNIRKTDLLSSSLVTGALRDDEANAHTSH